MCVCVCVCEISTYLLLKQVLFRSQLLQVNLYLEREGGREGGGGRGREGGREGGKER